MIKIALCGTNQSTKCACADFLKMYGFVQLADNELYNNNYHLTTIKRFMYVSDNTPSEIAEYIYLSGLGYHVIRIITENAFQVGTQDAIIAANHETLIQQLLKKIEALGIQLAW